jgi:hypothetical protein
MVAQKRSRSTDPLGRQPCWGPAFPDTSHSCISFTLLRKKVASIISFMKSFKWVYNLIIP